MSATLLINPTAMEAGLIAAAKARALTPARAAAFDRFASLGLPHKRMEGWRWTDLRAALREPVRQGESDNEVIAPSIFGVLDPFEITVMNAKAEWSGGPETFFLSFGAAEEETPDHPLGALAAAMSEARLEIAIPEGVRMERPILIRRIAGPGSCHALARVSLGKSASARVIESFHGVGRYFSNSSVEYRLDEGAALERFILQDGSSEGVETALATARLEADARLDQISLLFGAKAARVETQIACNGPRAHVSLSNASLVSAARHADFTTHIRLNAPASKLAQTHRAALFERGRGVFQGKFLCARAAQRTDARMEAHALLLSDQAEADHKPELEIYADDVAMSHGSTAGALDPDALFYLRQRGIAERAARALLTEAFIGAAFDGTADERLRTIFRRRMSVWLETLQ